MAQVIAISAGLLLCAALYTDLLFRKIPNFLTISFVCVGFLLNMTIFGMLQGGIIAFKGFATGLCIFMVPYILGYTGGGDVKLFGAIGAILGAYAILWIFLYSAIFGGIISLLRILQIKKISLVPVAMRSLMFLPANGKQVSIPSSNTIAYTCPIVFGYMTYCVLGGCV
ncbi:MAG: prepilin peptidase [Desulfobacula sp.]|uniref:A24 family peptidase n=1 Tax=Desulfobacula sp. TaxID=2593537 RepID=UPI0025BBA85B|nr:prepilin peptidase [Desulfobacula sp.]MCD4719816.1 prepilin peptidase [Desulfobacula sp.]